MLRTRAPPLPLLHGSVEPPGPQLTYSVGCVQMELMLSGVLRVVTRPTAQVRLTVPGRGSSASWKVTSPPLSVRPLKTSVSIWTSS